MVPNIDDSDVKEICHILFCMIDDIILLAVCIFFISSWSTVV